MKNLLSYCGLVDPRKSASAKNLPVHYYLLYFDILINFLEAKDFNVHFCMAYTYAMLEIWNIQGGNISSF